MRLKRLSLAGCVALTLALVLPAARAQAAKPKPVQLPITATGTTSTGTPVKFTGFLNVTRFVSKHGKVLAVGTVTGTVTDAAGKKTLGSVTDRHVRLPLVPPGGSGVKPSAAAAASCQILDLVLGPLHLNLLGLVVDLNQIHLTITAQQGPGNLLGNLLCAVANLLNQNPLNTGGLTQLLNSILGILRGL